MYCNCRLREVLRGRPYSHTVAYLRIQLQRHRTSISVCSFFVVGLVVFLSSFIGIALWNFSGWNSWFLPRAMSASADPEIVALLAGIEKHKLVSTVEVVLAKLETHKMARRMRLPPTMVGVHPQNRSGYGVSAMEVHALGADICAMGWSPAATTHAVCVEDDAQGSIAAFTTKLSNSSAGLGKVPAAEIKYGSLACSHTNQFLVAALCGAESEQESISVDGRISTSKLSEDGKLKDALEHGLTWLVLSSCVPAFYPTLCDLIQHARNATGAVQRKDSEIQLLVKIQSMVEAQSKASGGSVNWTEIKNAIMRRNVVELGDLNQLLKFVQVYGGGDSGKFIAELDSFHKVFVPSGRIIPASTFGAIAELKLQPSELCPFFASAVVKAQASCPQAKVANKVCNFISAGDIASCQGAKKQLMVLAENVLAECRAVVSRHSIDASIATKCLGRVDTLMARYVLKKEGKFETVTDIGAQFVAELNEALAKHSASSSGIASPWARPSAPTARSSRASVNDVPNVVQYDAGGKAQGAAKMSLLAAGCLAYV